MQLSVSNRRALASALKGHLKSKQLSFGAFANESGINNNTVSKLTQPDRFEQVQRATLKKLERALGKPWREIIAEPDAIKSDAAPRLVRPANGHAKPANDKNGSSHPMRRMLVIELCGSRVSIPSGVDVSILDNTTLRVR